MATKKDLTNDVKVKIFNNCIGSAGYTFNNGIYQTRRNWALPTSVLEIDLKELQAAFNEAGVRQQFEEYNKELGRYEDGALLIKDNSIREILGLKPLDKYVLDRDQVKDLLLNGSNNKLEDVLENCSNTVLDNIVNIAIELSINDMNKVTLIKAYSGKDIFTMIKEKLENNTGVKSRKSESNSEDDKEEGTKRKKA